MDLKKQTEIVMTAICDISEKAKHTGDGDLMCAANRAWRELYDHQTAMLKAALARKAS